MSTHNIGFLVNWRNNPTMGASSPSSTLYKQPGLVICFPLFLSLASALYNFLILEKSKLIMVMRL